jgi:hypothetical protein
MKPARGAPTGGKMPANAKKGAMIGSIAGLSMVLGLALTSSAGAETVRHPAHHKVHPIAREWPLAPGVELHTSTFASPGSENHYYSDTVASSHSDLMDMSHRYMQSASPLYNDTPDPLFQF